MSDMALVEYVKGAAKRAVDRQALVDELANLDFPTESSPAFETFLDKLLQA